MSISRAKYISPLVFTHYHKSENTSLGFVTQLKTTADLWNSLICHYGRFLIGSYISVDHILSRPDRSGQETYRPKTHSNWTSINLYGKSWETAAKMDGEWTRSVLCRPLWLTLISIKKRANAWPRDLESATEGRKKHQVEFDSFLSEQHLWQIQNNMTGLYFNIHSRPPATEYSAGVDKRKWRVFRGMKEEKNGWDEALKGIVGAGKERAMGRESRCWHWDALTLLQPQESQHVSAVWQSNL